MRKIVDSSKLPSRMRLRARADSRSLPNGFSTMTRAPRAHPDLPSCSTTTPNSTGGMAREWAGCWAEPSSLRMAANGAGVWESPATQRRREDNLAKAAGSRPPCFSTLSRARALSWSRFQPALATPTTGTFRWPRRTIPCSAGKIFLYARSPVAPKKTRAAELDSFMLDSLFRGFFEMSTELETHRREQLVLIIRLAARAEALIERGGEDRHRYGLVDGGLDRPASFSGVGNAARKLLQVGIF